MSRTRQRYRLIARSPAPRQLNDPGIRAENWSVPRKDHSALNHVAFMTGTSLFRLRRILGEVRSINGLTWTTLVLLVLGVQFRSWILLAVLVAVCALNLAQWLYFRYFLVRAGLEQVDEMTGWEFEKWLRRFLERVGYEVDPTPYRGDFGADFVVTWNGMRIAVQAKRSARLVGIRAVQEVVAAKSYYDCERAMVITNSYYTDEAAILARANGVLLRTRDDLARKTVELSSARGALVDPRRDLRAPNAATLPSAEAPIV